jgi:hypothetical protein
MANVSTRANPAADIKAESGAAVKRIVEQIALDAFPGAVFYGGNKGETDMKMSKELCRLDDDMWEAHRDYAHENDKDWANADELREDGLAIGEEAYKLNPENDYEHDVGDWETYIEGELDRYHEHQQSVVARAAYYRVQECAEEAADKAAKALAMAADITGAAK